MTEKDLSPIMRKAYESLSDEEEKMAFLEEQENLYREAMLGAIARVNARNTSHNVGKFLLKNQK